MEPPLPRPSESPAPAWPLGLVLIGIGRLSQSVLKTPIPSDLSHPRVELDVTINWARFEEQLGRSFDGKTGAPGFNPRLLVALRQWFERFGDLYPKPRQIGRAHV